MLSDNPAVSSPQSGFCPPTQAVPAPLRTSSAQVAIPDYGYVSPRQQLERRAVTPGSPFQPSQKPQQQQRQQQQQQQQHQHGLNAPRPSLSPLSEYHSGFTDEDLGPPCPSPSPSPSPYTIANHRRQHSFPNLLPLALGSRTPSPTRKTHQRYASDQMPFTGDGKSNGKAWASDSPRGGGGLVSWLSGSAGANGTSKDTTTPDTTPTQLRRSTASSDVATLPKNTATAASRFMSAISSRFNPAATTNTSVVDGDDVDDELCNLNLEAALFPHGAPISDRDPFSPAAFKNLHMNALGLLNKLQTAYRERVTALREMQAERSAQRDELEEAETRAQHLKMQLEGMSRKAHENERAMRSLMEELAAERRAREEERRLAAADKALLSPLEGAEGASMVSEDLGVDEDRRRRRWTRRTSHRTSWKSSGGEGDEYDSDENESAESESVFSRCRSPALASPLPPPPLPPQTAAHTAPSSSDGASPTMAVVIDGPGTATPHVKSVNATPKQKSGQQMSAFQKIIKGFSGDSGEGYGADGCANCKGQDASVAWDTVSLLKDENKHLKTRVGELEVAVEGALDLVNGIGL
ncbi:hypothetical protein MFIFM68171_10450 [Madurella fahalii]|uniref:Uncharacterized protein n=1 Tax=Madurella fahalii TaxID=1157608 RepID=A0ABQ0GR87_9PEZI